MTWIWTDDRVATLAALWERGTSARAIAAALCLPKDMVVDKAFHLGLKRRPGRDAARAGRRASKQPAWLNIPFLETAPHHCRYITRESEEGVFCCGLPKAAGTSYCGFHHALCFRPAGEGKRPPGRREVRRADTRRQVWPPAGDIALAANEVPFA